MSHPPRTRNFKAWANLMPGAPSRLIVVGEVETPASNHKPHLSPSSVSNPQGRLLLDLSINDTGGIGTQAFQFWPARYESPAGQGEYNEVVILWQGSPLMKLPVSEAH
ncbi:hypothetical protein [Sulfitobacter pacificus]|uniref:hypothetical protein n=1 Tax=Sulfitobacter pacificus TaxID=1499314 RepID=UPI00310C5477